MPRYTDTVDTVTNGDQEETETDHMWRQIDPVLYDAMN